MKKFLAIVISLIALNTTAQSHQAFQPGEWFRFRIHYGMFNASFATLEVKDATLKNQWSAPVDFPVPTTWYTGLFLKLVSFTSRVA